MTELNLLRKKIDKIDQSLIELLKERIEISREIGKIKKENGIVIYDKEREEAIIKKHTANEEKDTQKYIEKFLENIFSISKEVQNK